MRQFFFILIVAVSLVAVNAFAAKATLEEQLQSLDSGNAPPDGVSQENLYAVQTRYLPLEHKSELTIGGGMGMLGDSFLNTTQVELTYHFHFNDRWSVALLQDVVSNQFTSAEDHLQATQGAVPDVPYAYSRTGLLAEYHVFYGKFRWSEDSVSFFDQYIAAGPGVISMNTGTTGAGIADAGFVFWLGRWGSLRLGLKDYVYDELYRSGPQLTNNLMAHMDIGVVF